MNRKKLLDIIGKEVPEKVILVDDQDTNDIIGGILRKHKKQLEEYDAIAPYFYSESVWGICENLFDFCKENLRYKEETVNNQMVSSPQAILSRGWSDCKCYALFIAGVLDAYKRAGNKIDWCFCFASDKPFSDTPGHVFVSVFPETKYEIWVDPVLSYLDQQKDYWSYQYIFVKTSKKISGCGCNESGIFSGIGRMIGAVSSNIPFAEEQAGVKLDAVPGYPFWLPQLQLAPSGRLCFWSYPAIIYKDTASDPVYVDTFNFLIDSKFASQNGKFKNGGFTDGGERLGIRSDMDTTGSKSGYFWQDTTTFEYLSDSQASIIRTLLSVPMNYSTLPDVSKFQAGRQGIINPYSWIFLNIQYQINKLLAVPYNIYDAVPYNDSWARQFNKQGFNGSISQMTKFLSGCNFLIQPLPDPGFWDGVLQASPTIIAAIFSIVSLGAGTPLLLATAAAAGLKFAQSDINKNVKQNQQAAYTNTVANYQATLNAEATVDDKKKKILLLAAVAAAAIIITN